MSKKIVLAGACRTAIGSMGGAFNTVSAVELGAIVMQEAVKRTGIQPKDVEHVFMGCVLQAGQGQNPARQAAIRAGFPIETTAVTVNAVCGSGLESVNMAAQMILAGQADIVVAGGMENMSMSPYTLDKARFGYRMGNGVMTDTMLNDALWDAFHHYHMGITAENICERYHLSREELDQFAVISQQKAFHARASGKFEEEIVAVEVKYKKQTIIVNKDEGIRENTTMERIGKLKPAFKADKGCVTAANSSTINDGAAAIVVMSEAKAKELGITPMAVYITGALAGVEPQIMGTGPIASTRKAMKRADMTIEQFDIYEANEAFASQSIAVARELNLDEKKLNVNGGAIALGHPVGASGCRILVTLLHEMKRENLKTGFATLCIGGGMGCTVIVKREE